MSRRGFPLGTRPQITCPRCTEKIRAAAGTQSGGSFSLPSLNRVGKWLFSLTTYTRSSREKDRGEGTGKERTKEARRGKERIRDTRRSSRGERCEVKRMTWGGNGGGVGDDGGGGSRGRGGGSSAAVASMLVVVMVVVVAAEEKR
nr:methyl-CpG-binding domain protein 2-like [Megalopta genalis]